MLTLTPTACVFLAWLVVVQGFSLNMKIILASCTLVVFCAFSVFKNQTVGFGVVCFFISLIGLMWFFILMNINMSLVVMLRVGVNSYQTQAQHWKSTLDVLCTSCVFEHRRDKSRLLVKLIVSQLSNDYYQD